MHIPYHKQISVRLDNNHVEVVSARRKDVKLYPIADKSLQQIVDFCTHHNIDMSDTFFGRDHDKGEVIVHVIYESYEDVKERAEEQLKEQYQQYLRLKERFG